MGHGGPRIDRKVGRIYKFIGFGDILGPKHYKFMGFGDLPSGLPGCVHAVLLFNRIHSRSSRGPPWATEGRESTEKSAGFINL